MTGRSRNLRLALDHPSFVVAVAADARVALTYRMEGNLDTSSRWRLAVQILRLAWVSDAFFAQMCYRAKARLQALGVPLVPTIFHHLAQMTAQVAIGNPVVVQPGVYIAHGQVVIDGITRVCSGVVLLPWITIGLRAGNLQGPTIECGAHIGTGAKVIGPVTVGHDAVVGANAVVVSDVAPDTTVVGVPARMV